jgi:phosphoenolpyruvate carboxylase
MNYEGPTNGDFNPTPISDSFEATTSLYGMPFFTQVEKLKSLSSEDKHKTYKQTQFDGLQARVSSMQGYYKDTLDNAGLQAANDETLNMMKRTSDGATRSFDDFMNLYESSSYGMVTTGHPVTPMSEELAGCLVNSFNARAGDPPDHAAIKATDNELREAMNGPFVPPTLLEEITRSHTALHRVHDDAEIKMTADLKFLRENYPDDWKSRILPPPPISTWLPFDMDGRNDVTGAVVIRERVRLQVEMLGRYKASLAGFETQSDGIDTMAGEVRATLDIMESILADFDQDEPDLAAIQNRLEDTKGQRLMNMNGLADRLTDLDMDGDDEIAQQMLISQMTHYGASLARPHFRINSGNIDKTAEIANEYSLKSLSETDNSVEKQLGSQKFSLDLIDDQTQCRQLIAETHSYEPIEKILKFGKQLGVDHMYQISPLIEDHEGYFNSEKIVTEMATNPDYAEYLKKVAEKSPSKQLQFFMQWGMSDAAREQGGLSALDCLETFPLKARDIIKANINGANVLNFSTGGDSYGRGMVSQDLLQHLDIIANAGGHTEQSFQGADAQIKIRVKNGALANLVYGQQKVVRNNMNSNELPSQNIIDARNAIYGTQRDEHLKIFADEKYARTIDVFKNFMGITGSRAVKRAAEAGGARALPRAIQHNGAMQQLGHLATLSYGLGKAIQGNEGQFDTLWKNDDTFKRNFINMMKAIDLVDEVDIRANIELYNPEYWSHLARRANDQNDKRKYALIASEMETLDVYDSLTETVDTLVNDLKPLRAKADALSLPEEEWHQDNITPRRELLRTANVQRFAAAHDVLLDGIDRVQALENQGYFEDSKNNKALVMEELMALNPSLLEKNPDFKSIELPDSDGTQLCDYMLEAAKVNMAVWRAVG